MESFTLFRIFDQDFAVETGKVIETVKVDMVFKVPGSPEYLEGVINLRNNVIPLLNSGILLWGKPLKSDTSIILECDSSIVSISVSGVKGITNLDKGKIRKALKKDVGEVKKKFIKGIFEVEGKSVFVLNLNAVVGRRTKKKEHNRTAQKTMVNRTDQEDLTKRRGFVIFQIGDEWFGIEVTHVKEIIDCPQNVSPVPRAPEYVSGVFVFRDQNLPVVSLKKFLSIPSHNKENRALILEKDGGSVCLVVDDVKEIKWIREEEIIRKNESTSGVVALDNGKRLVTLLEVSEIFDPLDISTTESVVNNGDVEVLNMKHFIQFSIANIDMAIPIEKVKEVVDVETVTPVPESPPYIVGVYNLRNKVITIVSVAKRTGIDSNEDAGKVVVLEKIPAGLLVSKLKGILNADESQIEPSEKFKNIEGDLIDGVIKKSDGSVVFILNPFALFKDEDLDLGAVKDLVKSGDGHGEERRSP